MMTKIIHKINNNQINHILNNFKKITYGLSILICFFTDQNMQRHKNAMNKKKSAMKKKNKQQQPATNITNK